MALQQGTRLYYATAATAWVDLAAGAAPSGSFTQVTGGINIRVVPHEVEQYDDSDLEDTAEEPQVNQRPGNITFSINLHTTASVTLRGLCAAGTKKTWAVLYKDGTADTVDGRIICTSGAEAQKGDFKAKVTETYQILGDTVIERQAAV